MWKPLYLRPPAASRSAVGVRHGPPNVLDAPKPDIVEQHHQHVRCARGGSSGSIGGKAVSGSFASYVVMPGAGRSGIGSIARA